MRDIFREPSREIPVIARPQVLVVGGGPAGIAAAVSAARLGVDVMLVERYGFLGGMATAALVGPLMTYHTRKRQIEKRAVAPDQAATFDTTGRRKVIRGILDDFVGLLLQLEGTIGPRPDYGYMVPFDPEIFKRVAFWMVEDAGVTLLLHTLCVDAVVEDGVVKGAIVENKSGRGAVLADAVVDVSGDGDVAARAGAPFEIGRAEDGKTQPMTLMFHIGGVDMEAFLAYKRAHPDQFRGEAGLYDLIEKATEAGDLDLPREDILFFKLPRRGEIVVNTTRVINVLGTDAWDLTRAEIESRNQAVMLLKFFKGYVPGFANSYIIQTATQVGVRETRRIIGEYVISAEDIIFDRKFDDVIARAAYPIDIHNPEGKGTVMIPLEPGASYDIPYRCIVPRHIDNLLVAGKCMSGTHEAQGSFRVIPISMATGQAAGVAAALSVEKGRRPRDLLAEEVQLELLKQNAELGPNVTREAIEKKLSGADR